LLCPKQIADAFNPITGDGRLALAGGLLAYAVDLNEMAQRRAWYVDEILRGTPPGDLPFEEVSKYQLFINVGTARAIGAHNSTKPHRHF